MPVVVQYASPYFGSGFSSWPWLTVSTGLKKPLPDPSQAVLHIDQVSLFK